MFDFVRKHTRIMQFLLFILIVPSFVLFGIEGYSNFNDKGAVVASVAGDDISQTEWDNAHAAEANRLRESMPDIDAKLLDSPELKFVALEKLVRDRVLAAAAAELRLTASDQRLARELQQNPVIAQLRKADGSMDMDRYRQLASSQGLTPEGLEARIRANLSQQQVVDGVSRSGALPRVSARLALTALTERREVALARFKPADFAAEVKPGDAEIERFYKDNLAQFQAPEQADVEYVVLDMEAVGKTITLNEQDVKTYYEQNAVRLGAREERRASHILLVTQGLSAADKAKARARADELLQAVRNKPDSLAELAKKNSQDPGSAQNGGDLDFFARGAMVKPFEDAVFAPGLKKGDVAPLVESEYGYHIIRLTDIRAPKQRSFEEMRPEIEADLKKQQAQRKFAEAAETFSNLVYEQADSFKPVADRLQLTVRSAQNVVRAPGPAQAGVLANPKLLEVLFSADSVSKKRNTEAVDLGASQLVSARIVKHQPARALPLEAVKDVARARLVALRSAELARQQGSERLAAWRATPALAKLAPAVVVSRGQAGDLPARAVDAIMRLETTMLPAWSGVDLGADGYLVVRLDKVLPGDASAADAGQLGQQLTRAAVVAEENAYLAWLREKHRAKIIAKMPANPAAASLP